MDSKVDSKKQTPSVRAPGSYSKADPRGSIIQGYVTEILPNATYTINSMEGRILSGALYAGSVFTGLLGFNTNTVLPIGTPVMVTTTQPPVIVATLPDEFPDSEHGASRSLLGSEDNFKTAETAGSNGAQAIPKDMLEGEFELCNAFGVSLTMLTSLAQLKAGDRAKVETHLLNDMVRIVAGKFVSLSALGDESIYSDGRNNSEEAASSYPHEVFGAAEEGEPLLELDGDSADMSAVDRLNSTGRWRYLEYKGWLGDFIHSFVTDPLASIGSMAEDGVYSGKSMIHRGNDGTILMQSVADIALERVVRITVPRRIKAEDDPDLQKAKADKDFASLNSEYLKMWKYDGTGKKNMFQAAYQLREYARYLSRHQSLARFAQAAEEFQEFEVPTEQDIPEPEWTNHEKDREGANGDATEYVDTYSCFRILRDGSQVMHDGYGSTVMLSNGNVQISSARHIDLEAAGDLRLVAGQNIFMKARNSIEISAKVGGLILKSRTLLKAFCEKGVLWLRGSADPEDDSSYVPEEGDPEAEVLQQAVYVEAVNGELGIRGKRKVHILSDGDTADEFDAEALEDKTSGVHLESRNANVSVSAPAGHAVLAAARTLSLRGSSRTVMSSPRIYSDAQEVDINGKFNLRGPLLTIDTLLGERALMRAGIAGPERKSGYGPHTNHIDIVPDSLVLTFGEDTDTLDKLGEAASAHTSYSGVWSMTEPKFKMYKGTEHFADSIDAYRPETLTQQYLRLDSVDHWEDAEFGDWNWSSDAIEGDARLDGPQIMFGAEGENERHSGGESLREPGTRPVVAEATEASSWGTTPISTKYLKYNK